MSLEAWTLRRGAATRRRVWIGFWATVLGMAVHTPVLAARASTLAARLESSGRATARFVRVTEDPLQGGRTSTLRGRLVLEAPGRASLTFTATGERVVVRGDGGEWLQPALRQLIRFGASHAAFARSAWEVLSSAKSAGPGRVTVAYGAESDSAHVTLGPDGLPTEFEYFDGAMRHHFRFVEWRFSGARRDSAFRIDPPKDFEIVTMP